MVFKNPYGYLIKHFKIIHLILTGIYIFLTMQVSGVLGFYNNFLLGTVGKIDAVNYVNNYYMIAVILSIIICIVIYALLRYKKKPRVLYLGLIGFSLIIALIINLVYGGLEKISVSVLDIKTLRLYRDLLRILVVFQYGSVLIVLVRGLGFDIKKFNFVADLQELNMDVTDEEEVELTLGSTNSLQRKFHRRVRELKYYYLENKVFILIILGVVLICGAGAWFINDEVVNKVYLEGESFNTDEFSFRVLDSFVTNKDYNNKVIGKENDSFVVVRMNVTPNYGKKSLNLANLILKTNYNSYSSDSYYGARFVDLGVAYRSQEVSGDYLFIFKVKAEDIKDKMQLFYTEERVVELSPVMLDSTSGDVINYKLGDVIDFSSSVLGGGSFKIDAFEVASSFPYSYNYEISGENFSGQYSIMSSRGGVLNLKIASSFVGDLNNYSFLSRYGVLKYKVNDIEYVVEKFDDKTPGNYKEGLYLAVDKRMLEAQEIWLDISIRDKQYVYKLK